MKAFVSNYKLKAAFISSVVISIIVLLGQMLVVLREVQEHRYFISMVLIFVVCLLDWALLIALDYMPFYRRGGQFARALYLVIYFLFAVGAFFLAVEVGSHFPSSEAKTAVAHGNYLYRRALVGVIFSMLIYLVNYSVSLFEERERILLENERLLRENLQAKFETLRQQVNPHFLFNSLSTLKTMMNTNVAEAEEYLMHLSSVFRYSLQTNDREKVPLREELSVLEAYCSMLKSRFGENILFDIHIDKQHLNLFIPPFTLQIVVENCIKHNIVSSEKPLWIKVHSIGDMQILISNKLQPKISVEGSLKVGLANIEKRYQDLSRQHISVVRNNETFDVVIPLISAQ